MCEPDAPLTACGEVANKSGPPASRASAVKGLGQVGRRLPRRLLQTKLKDRDLSRASRLRNDRAQLQNYSVWAQLQRRGMPRESASTWRLDLQQAWMAEPGQLEHGVSRHARLSIAIAENALRRAPLAPHHARPIAAPSLPLSGPPRLLVHPVLAVLPREHPIEGGGRRPLPRGGARARARLGRLRRGKRRCRSKRPADGPSEAIAGDAGAGLLNWADSTLLTGKHDLEPGCNLPTSRDLGLITHMVW